MGTRKIQNQGDARPQAHDKMTVDASKPAKETVKPEGHKQTVHKPQRTTPKRDWNTKRG